MSEKREGYMCMIDFDHELGEAMGGNKIYPSVADLKRNHKMWKECGIVEVSIQFVSEIAPQDIFRKDDDDETN